MTAPFKWPTWYILGGSWVSIKPLICCFLEVISWNRPNMAIFGHFWAIFVYSTLTKINISIVIVTRVNGCMLPPSWCAKNNNLTLFWRQTRWLLFSLFNGDPVVNIYYVANIASWITFCSVIFIDICHLSHEVNYLNIVTCPWGKYIQNSFIFVKPDWKHHQIKNTQGSLDRKRTTSQFLTH